MERSRQGTGRASGPTAFIGSVSGVLWGSQAKSSLVNLPKRVGFGNVERVLSKGCTRESPGHWGRVLITRVLSAGVISGAYTYL